MVSDATIGAVQGRSTLKPSGSQQNAGAVQNNRNQSEDAQESRTTTRTSGTSTAEAQGSETRNNGQQESPALQTDVNSSTVQFTGSEERGSVIDITV